MNERIEFQAKVAIEESGVVHFLLSVLVEDLYQHFLIHYEALQRRRVYSPEGMFIV